MSLSVREHILLTVLGRLPKPASYVLDGRREDSGTAPAALYALLPETDRPSRVLALCTPEAEAESLPVLRTCLGADCPVEVVTISAEPTDEAVHVFLATLARRVPAGAHLTVDVTHGLRHLSFLTYMGVLYLTALRGVQLRAAYYGMLDPHGGDSPFLDVRPLVDLPDWFHALRVLKETGSAQAMAKLVADGSEEAAGRVGEVLRSLSMAYGWGLPVDLGYYADRFLAQQVEPLRQVLHARRLPLADELIGDLEDALSKQRIAQDLPDGDWKAAARLDRAELERQAGLIDGFLIRGDYATAFGLMREWLVLWTMWCTNDRGDWLDYRGRLPAERLLNRIAEQAKAGSRRQLTNEQLVVGRVWSYVREPRNFFAHRGLEKGTSLSAEVLDSFGEVGKLWQETLKTVPECSFELPPPEGRVLVSPVGLRPGVLFSALQMATPRQVSRCLVICSAETEGAIRQACQAAGYAGDVVPVRFEDPFAGVAELDGLTRQARRCLDDAEEVLVNVTGGTTLMGVLADRIAGRARRSGRSVHRFALVDRRPLAEQETDPYQAGERCWLDDPPEEARA